MPSKDSITSGPTFAEMLVQTGLLAEVGAGTRAIIAQANQNVEAFAKKHLTVISCHGCTVQKWCCCLKTAAYLHEAVPIVARLKREGRDTPELRAFATLKGDGETGAVRLPLEEQERFVADFPAVFAPESGAWGLQGWTRIQLLPAAEESIGEAMTLAWQSALKTPTKPRGRGKKRR